MGKTPLLIQLSRVSLEKFLIDAFDLNGREKTQAETKRMKVTFW